MSSFLPIAPTAFGGPVEPIDYVGRIDLKSFRDIQELDDIQAPFTSLILGNERLRSVEPRGKFYLRNTARLTCFHEH